MKPAHISLLWLYRTTLVVRIFIVFTLFYSYQQYSKVSTLFIIQILREIKQQQQQCIRRELKVSGGDQKEVIHIRDGVQVDAAIPQQQQVDVNALKLLIDRPELTEFKDKVRRAIATSDVFKASVAGMPSDEYKQLVYEQLKYVGANLIRFTYPRDHVDLMSAGIEILSTYNNNICTKLGVHYSLWGGTILLLGTKRHEKYIEPSDKLSIVGSFSMTEMGHGSNVRGLETTATFDRATKEFVVHSPSPSAYKVWIGGTALHAHYTTVFARLVIDSKDYGVHAFVVPIRDATSNKVLPGITIHDCGPKLGLNGIDNGQLRFDKVRIPLDNLLNRFSNVAEDGAYTSQFDSPVKNFAATMAPFIAGRLYIVKSSTGPARTSLTAAIRYGFYRKQFGPTQTEEYPLMTLASHQRRLLVPLARSMTLDLYTQQLEKLLQSKRVPASAHAHAAGLKAIYSWHCVATLQVCRESCGGQGYRSENKIAEFKNDCDVNCTYEGDNTVLMQQVAKYILAISKDTQADKPIHIDGNPKQVLYDFSNLLALFKTRENIKVKELRELIQPAAKGAKEEYIAFSNAIPWALKAAFAYMDRIFLENAIARIATDAKVTPMVQLILLDTLARIEEDLGWFLGHGLISPSVANSIPFLVVDLCKQITPHALSIVKAYDIPSKCLPNESLTEGMKIIDDGDEDGDSSIDSFTSMEDGEYGDWFRDEIAAQRIRERDIDMYDFGDDEEQFETELYRVYEHIRQGQVQGQVQGQGRRPVLARPAQVEGNLDQIIEDEDEEDEEEEEEDDDQDLVDDIDGEMPVDYGDFDFNIDRVLGYINNQNVYNIRDALSQFIRAAGANGSLLFGNALTAPDVLKDKMDSLPLYGSQEFSFDPYYDIINQTISSKDQLDQVALKFLQLDEPILSKLGKDKYKFPYCQHEWTEKTWFFRCKDCEITQTSCICLDCFKNGNHIHEGHSFMPEQSNQGGCCDCGNSDSWKPEGFCSSHFLPEKPIHPSDLIDPELKKKFHLFLRVVLSVLVDIINKDRSSSSTTTISPFSSLRNSDYPRITFIVTWLEDLASNSYPVSHILTEEFAQRELDQTTFSLHEPTPLPYISPPPTEDNNNNNQKDSDQVYLAHKSQISPLISVLSAIEKSEHILQATKTLLVTMMGNKLFKVVFCNEFLSYYERFALSPSSNMRIIVSSISCQMFEIPSIVQSFSTGYSTHNLILKIIDVFAKLIEHGSTYDFDLPTNREEYEQYLVSQDFYYISGYFKYEKISKFVYENEIVFSKIFSLCRGIQGITPIKRQLTEALPYELPVISNLIGLENQNINCFNNFLQSIHKLKYPSSKFLKLLISNIPSNEEIIFPPFENINQYKYPVSDIFNGVTSISIHQPFARLFGNYCLNALHFSPDYSLEAVKALLPLDKLLYIFNSILSINVLMFQNNACLWEKNLNVNEFKSYYTWSFMVIDIFTMQYISIILGPNYFLNLLINSFTSNFKSIETNKTVIPDLFKLIIQILQNRSSPIFGLPEARYHLVQAVISNYKSHSALMNYRREFTNLDSLEDLIEEITEQGTENKKLLLKEKNWERYDHYYPYHFCERDAFADLSLNHYHEHLKKKKDPLEDTYPLPPVLEPLHPNLAAVNDIFDEPLLYNIMFLYLLKFVRPTSMLTDSFQMLTFLDNPCFSSDQKQMENLTNHILYLLVLGIRTFIDTIIPNLNQNDLDSLKSKIHILINNNQNNHNNNQNNNSTIDNKMILLIFKRYNVIGENGEKTQICILDLVLNLFEIMQNTGKYAEKKSLISKLLTMLGDFDKNLLDHFHTKVNMDDFVKAQGEREFEAKKKEAMLRQKAIREKMMQQQIQFLQQNGGDDDEMSEDSSSASAATGNGSSTAISDDMVCVSCKETTRNGQKPVALEGRLFDGFYCPLCNRTCNILLAVDSVGQLATSEELIMSLFEADTTFRHFPESLNSINFRYVWKFPLCNIENLEISSRLNRHYAQEPYYIYSESDFKNQLRTLRLLYYNIMSVPVPTEPPTTAHVDLLMSDKYSAENDPFTLASFSHFFNRSMDVNVFIEKAYERLVFLIFSTTAERYFTANLLNTIDYEDLLSQQFETLKVHLTVPEAVKETSSGFVLGFIKKVNKRIQPFIRKAYLLLHCIKSMAQPLGNENDFTQQQFENQSFLLGALGLRDPLECVLNPKFNELGKLYSLSKANTNFLSYIPLKTPSFIDLPSMYIDFLMDFLMVPCEKGSCDKLPKGVCLVCAKVICLDDCCSEELLKHTHNCGNGLIITLGIINPTVNVYSHGGSVATSNVYFDKHGEPSTKTKPNLKLNPTALRELYINWIKGVYLERSF
ncbi:hypothetical protein DFA_11547 [Cavenderia fasciculata]|uniref:UBR-type domain-containing protein n=1 Tax=Cavenderia fasciculata TaxID=261658 RepID=F4QDI9_CACFS|nr:uncharacterized protein DFA_11547 [Cavenderia fasciculata]EGG13786.1 hypothetical protein DFA_11547 [Cavenderia fasciculata]|eukprot:XP_004350494.1 hypothetical protein DFA_11547 [Cavenderia fasciculata]